MEAILRLYLTYIGHELIADSQLAFSHSNAGPRLRVHRVGTLR
jgi:hypothetical protein